MEQWISVLTLVGLVLFASDILWAILCLPLNRGRLKLQIILGVFRAFSKLFRNTLALSSKISYRWAKGLGKANVPWWAKPFAWLLAASLGILGFFLSIPAEIVGASTAKK